MFRPQVTSLACPHCGFSYQVPIYAIIDAQSAPELKQAFLSGQINVSQCPSCKQINAIATPILYHDAEHEFLGIFIPPQINIPQNQRQKIIGDLTRALMDALPPEKRRGYMLTPKEFFTQEKMAETILGFDGITPEMIAATRRKMELVQKLLTLQEDETAFTAAVNNNKADIDAEFFSMLTQIIAASQELDEKEASQLSELREKLLPLTPDGQRILRQREAVEKLGERPTRQQILQIIEESDIDQVQAIAIVAMPLLDYQFFSMLTERIEQSSGEAAEVLAEKRAAILDIQETIRQQEESHMRAVVDFLQQLLQAEDLEAAVRQNINRIDTVVMAVLQANLEEARANNDTPAIQRLGELWQTINRVVEENLPAEMRLLLDLLAASYPDDTKAILEAHKGNLPPNFTQMLKGAIADLEKQESEEARQQARHLRNVLTQASLM